MKVLVCGDRNWKDKELVYSTLSSMKIDIVIEGEARGADTIAREYAENNGLEFKPFPADWNKYGKAAGHIRNRQMLDECDMVIAFHDNLDTSKGTADCVNEAKRRGITAKVVRHEKSCA